MSLLRIECTGCRSVLQVRAELAGQQGKCPKCGAEITIPTSAPAHGSATPPPPVSDSTLIQPVVRGAATLPLSQAMAPDMLAEIFRRKKSAVMVVFETPKSGSYQISGQADANVRCYRTEDMSDAQLMQVLEQVGHMSQGKRNQKGGVGLQPDGPPPYEIKGDRLGMTLDEFKAKYVRKVGGMTMPYCSDNFPGQSNPSLWSEPWHATAGIVHGRVDLPSENNSPTLAGVKTDLLLYKFVDGRLFRMMATFDTEAFHIIRDAMAQKYGPPKVETKEPVEITWDNGVSAIRLSRGAMRPKKASMLQLVHHELQKCAEGRMPKRTDDL